MERPNLEGIVLPPMPEGLEMRPVLADQLRQLWDADVEAFLDHWGGFDASDGRFERLAQRPQLRRRASTWWPGRATRSPAA